jgi:hypothetical protein
MSALSLHLFAGLVEGPDLVCKPFCLALVVLLEGVACLIVNGTYAGLMWLLIGQCALQSAISDAFTCEVFWNVPWWHARARAHRATHPRRLAKLSRLSMAAANVVSAWSRADQSPRSGFPQKPYGWRQRPG